MSLPTDQSKLDIMQRKIARMKQELVKEFESVMHESFKNYFQNPLRITFRITQL